MLYHSLFLKSVLSMSLVKFRPFTDSLHCLLQKSSQPLTDGCSWENRDYPLPDCWPGVGFSKRWKMLKARKRNKGIKEIKKERTNMWLTNNGHTFYSHHISHKPRFINLQTNTNTTGLFFGVFFGEKPKWILFGMPNFPSDEVIQDCLPGFLWLKQ